MARSTRAAAAAPTGMELAVMSKSRAGEPFLLSSTTTHDGAELNAIAGVVAGRVGEPVDLAVNPGDISMEGLLLRHVFHGVSECVAKAAESGLAVFADASFASESCLVSDPPDENIVNDCWTRGVGPWLWGLLSTPWSLISVGVTIVFPALTRKYPDPLSVRWDYVNRAQYYHQEGIGSTSGATGARKAADLMTNPHLRDFPPTGLSWWLHCVFHGDRRGDVPFPGAGRRAEIVDRAVRRRPWSNSGETSLSLFLDGTRMPMGSPAPGICWCNVFLTFLFGSMTFVAVVLPAFVVHVIIDAWGLFDACTREVAGVRAGDGVPESQAEAATRQAYRPGGPVMLLSSSLASQVLRNVRAGAGVSEPETFPTTATGRTAAAETEDLLGYVEGGGQVNQFSVKDEVLDMSRAGGNAPSVATLSQWRLIRWFSESRVTRQEVAVGINYLSMCGGASPRDLLAIVSSRNSAPRRCVVNGRGSLVVDKLAAHVTDNVEYAEVAFVEQRSFSVTPVGRVVSSRSSDRLKCAVVRGFCGLLEQVPSLPLQEQQGAEDSLFYAVTAEDRTVEAVIQILGFTNTAAVVSYVVIKGASGTGWLLFGNAVGEVVASVVLFLYSVKSGKCPLTAAFDPFHAVFSLPPGSDAVAMAVIILEALAGALGLCAVATTGNLDSFTSAYAGMLTLIVLPAVLGGVWSRRVLVVGCLIAYTAELAAEAYFVATLSADPLTVFMLVTSILESIELLTFSALVVSGIAMVGEARDPTSRVTIEDAMNSVAFRRGWLGSLGLDNICGRGYVNGFAGRTVAGRSTGFKVETLESQVPRTFTGYSGPSFHITEKTLFEAYLLFLGDGSGTCSFNDEYLARAGVTVAGGRVVGGELIPSLRCEKGCFRRETNRAAFTATA